MDEFNKVLESKSNEVFLNYFQNDYNCVFVIENNLFWKNIDIIVKNYKNITLNYIIKKLLKIDINFINPKNFIKLVNLGFSKILCVNILSFLKKNNINLNEYLRACFKNKSSINILNYLIYDACCNEKFLDIYNNVDYVVLNFDELISYIDLFKKNDEVYNKLTEYINKHQYIYLRNILKSSLNINTKRIEEEKIMPYFNEIIKEVLKYENVNCSDIKLIGEGGSSRVYQIGNKILKLGRGRLGFKIKNNKRFLRPLLREKVNSVFAGTLFYIEITEKVETGNITYEDAYQVYKELRDEGLVWIDCYPSNIGRLEKSNKVYFDNQIDPVSSAINYNGDIDDELGQGELVILDNELIFSEEEFLEKLGFNYEYDENICIYEKRYQKERNKKTINF